MYDNTHILLFFFLNYTLISSNKNLRNKIRKAYDLHKYQIYNSYSLQLGFACRVKFTLTFIYLQFFRLQLIKSGMKISTRSRNLIKTSKS